MRRPEGLEVDEMKIQRFFDPVTSTLTYLPFDELERVGVVIDSVLDFDPVSGRTSTTSADAVARFLEAEGIRVPFVLDTHAHADHLSAMQYFKERFGAQTVIGADIVKVQRVFRDLFNLGDTLPPDGRQFDVLLADGDVLDVGSFKVEALHTPGHTPACMSYRIDDALFVGDALFQPDYGTARCDFPSGSADDLYTSIRGLYQKLPGETRVYTCHDYQPGGRELEFESTIAEQRRLNVQLNESTTRKEFVAFREQRDATLAMPELILPSIQINVRAGEFPPSEGNGVSYLKLPLNVFGGKS
jgi:glyoxylase-like metal-dependent hydrolase (beta-lactamase superfamily II)